MTHWFVVPDLAGPPSGGTVYNRELLKALARAAFPAQALTRHQAESFLASGAPGVYWVDTLYLESFEALRRARGDAQSVGLLAHYLPSLVAAGSASCTTGDLRADERFALAQCDALLAPSAYMARRLGQLGATGPTLVVEPACSCTGVGAEAAHSAPYRVLMVASLTAGKGVAEFLSALSVQLRDHDTMQLEIVGNTSADASYAAACFELVRKHACLARRVSFAGLLAPEHVAERISHSALLVSASRMESFGMAVAEARTAGVPVVALARGNLPALLSPAAGSVLVDSDQELAVACLQLTREQKALSHARELARKEPREPRSFADAAREFAAQASILLPSTRQ